MDWGPGRLDTSCFRPWWRHICVARIGRGRETAQLCRYDAIWWSRRSASICRATTRCRQLHARWRSPVCSAAPSTRVTRVARPQTNTGASFLSAGTREFKTLKYVNFYAYLSLRFDPRSECCKRRPASLGFLSMSGVILTRFKPLL